MNDAKHPARNATVTDAALAGGHVAGNPVIAGLESGVGNCFPGLECDIRNLERRFFPHLVVDFTTLSAGAQTFSTALVREVDLTAARAAALPPETLAAYESIAADAGDPAAEGFWFVSVVEGRFGSFGDLELRFLDLVDDALVTNLGQEDTPDDAWTAVRLLPEGADVRVLFRRSDLASSHDLTAPRAAYLDEHGALGAIFEPGEMTQSLCSPWTHDFRDCGCFYWASNHPDIALQPRGAGDPDPDLDRPAVWQRGDRGTPADPAPPADADGPAGPGPFGPREEMDYYEINSRWQELGIVLDEREQGDAYRPGDFDALPFASVEELEEQVRYAAGVELAVTLEYLSAAYSLDRSVAGGTLADDVRASFSEILRIAIGEMRHMRAVNDLLRAMFERGLIAEFRPALQVAAELPTGGDATRPLAFRPLDGETLQSFIDIERPSFSVDGLYGRIFATVRQLAPGPLEALVQAIMAEGTDHFETFSFIQEWLSRHPPSAYLLDLQAPDASIPEHVTLQARYRDLLETLHQGYAAGLPGGASDLADARAAMLAVDGLRGACETLAQAGIAVTFEAPDDPRFTPLPKP